MIYNICDFFCFSSAERNCAFHKNMQKFMGQMYLSSGKEIKSINQHLASSHTAIQVSFNPRHDAIFMYPVDKKQQDSDQTEVG